MRLIAIFLILLSSTLWARDFEWKHLDFVAANGTEFSLDIKLDGTTYSMGQVYYTDIWVHVSDYRVSSAHAIVYNYVEGNPTPLEVKEFDLRLNFDRRVFEAPVPYGLKTLSHYDGLYRLQRTYQKIAILINGEHWLQVPNRNDSTFTFNIFNLFGI